MKRSNFFTFIIAIPLALCALFPATDVLVAEAGASMSRVVSEASIKDGTINKGDFFIEGGVKAVGSTVVFDESCDNYSSLIGTTRIVNRSGYGVEYLLKGKMYLEIDDIVENGYFSVCFGLSSLSSSNTSKGVVEIKFTYNEGITVKIAEHLGNVESVLLSARQFEAMQSGSKFLIEFNVTTDGLFDFYVGGDKVVDGKQIYEGGAGFFAIFSNGRNTVKLSGMSVNGYSYDLPENLDYVEDFNDNSYNSNVFHSESAAGAISPSYVKVEDGKLVFNNTGSAHFTTKYSYSNFELSFDITDLQREVKYNSETGNIEKLISNWFAIAFGVDDFNQSADNTLQLATTLQLEGTRGSTSVDPTDMSVPYDNPRFILWDKNNRRAEDIEAMPLSARIWDSSFIGKTVNVKFSVIDGVVKLFIKTSEVEKWDDIEPCYSYNLGFTPTGCIRIFTWAEKTPSTLGVKYNSMANFSIDNFKISNMDYVSVKKNTVVVEKTSNATSPAPDYDYKTTPEDSDLLANRIDEYKGCGGAVSPFSGGIALCLLAVPVLMRRKKHE